MTLPKSTSSTPKMGDWVIVTQEHKGNDARNGSFGKVVGYDPGCDRGIKYRIGSSPHFTYESWCEDVRLATQEEIDRFKSSFPSTLHPPTASSPTIEDSKYHVLDTQTPIIITKPTKRKIKVL